MKRVLRVLGVLLIALGTSFTLRAHTSQTSEIASDYMLDSLYTTDSISPLMIDSLSLHTQVEEREELKQQTDKLGQGSTADEAVAKGKLVTLPRKRTVSSTKAVLFSIIPGGGQIYNRQYWKLPIVLGAYTACYYAINWNNNNLQEYATAFRDIKSQNPLDYNSWKEFLPYNANPEDYINNTSFHEQLRRGRDFYRRYRDMSIIISVAVYALVMIDAYVDAELYNFDISPNLSLTYSPTVIPASTTQMHNGYGVHVALTF